MTYSETLEWMFSQLPMYQQVGNKAYRNDLSNITKLAQQLDQPHKKFKTVHVAGTNGKGSVSHMLASVLQESGYKTGLYTSPHLRDFRERIRINGQVISEEAVVAFISENKRFLEQGSFSFFEMSVGMAFQYFAREEVDIAIIEVGLGGRLDSTNIISPEISVITNIGFDHVSILGNTLAKIAAEKGGIIKEHTPVIIGEYHEETFPVLKAISEEKNADFFLAENYAGPVMDSDLKGHYQAKNKKTVSLALEILSGLGWNIPDKAKENGFRSVTLNTGLRGRWDVLREEPKVICDTAHNKEGLSYVLEQLKGEEFEVLHFVLGVVNDKDLDAILPLFPKKAKYYFSKPDVPRGLEASALCKKAAGYALFGNTFPSVTEAYETAMSEATERDIIFVGGSTFTVAEII